MPLFLIITAVFIASVLLLIKKGRGKLLINNLVLAFCYGLVLILGAISADGWDGLGFLLALIFIAAIHLLVLFILALALPDRKQTPGEKVKVAASASPETRRRRQIPLPPQDPARRPVRHRPASPGKRQMGRRRIPNVKSDLNPTERRALEYLDDRSGGELEFED